MDASPSNINLCQNETICSITTGLSDLTFANNNIYFDDSASTVTFRCDDKSCSGADIFCPQNNGECNIICDSPLNYICSNIIIHADKTKSLKFTCNEASGCQNMIIYGPDDTISDSQVDIDCLEYYSCRFGKYYLSNVDNIDIKCDSDPPNVNDGFSSACQSAKYYMENAKDISVSCGGGYDCGYAEYHADNAQSFVIDCDKSGFLVGGSYVSVYGCEHAEIDCRNDGNSISIELGEDDGYQCDNPQNTPSPTLQNGGINNNSNGSRVYSIFVWFIVLL